MKKATLKLTALVTLLGVMTISVNAQNTNKINVVTSAVPFLRISPDARSGGMGDIGIATSADANSIYWNLAKTPFSTNKAGIGATYTPWLKDLGLNDVYLATLSGYYKLDEMSALSASFRYFSLGKIQFTDNLGNDLNQFSPREFAFDLGYSRKLGAKSSLGLAARYINSNLTGGQTTNGASTKTGSTVAADLSFFHKGAKENGEGLSWGIVLSNLGGKISYSDNAIQKDFLPADLGIGIAYTKVVDESNKLTFGLDLHKLMVPTPPASTDTVGINNYRTKGVVSSWFSSFGDAPDGFSEEIKEVQASVGAEYVYNNQFAFRAGYFYENPAKGNRKYFTLGAGLKYNMVGLNFSYLLPQGSGVNRNPLSNTLRFSLTFEK
ncbi:MAG: type IX secretion system outer membrane channel protein PorV [Ferruginibacter sp.]